MRKMVKATIQQWGDSLAVRIPASIARSANFKVGQPVELIVENFSVKVRSVGFPPLTLAQKLALFDPSKHSGEAMPSR